VIKLASPAAIATSIAAATIVLSIPAIILRYEKRLLAMAELGLAATPASPRAEAAGLYRPAVIAEPAPGSSTG
jgi:hypothetical protein